MSTFGPNHPVYLDHAATTPVDPEVREAMRPLLKESFGNPSSIHALGQRARMALDEARETVAACIGAQPSEIIFTSGGTESNNMAIRGVLGRLASLKPHVVTTQIEHEAVLEICRDLEQTNADLSYLPVNSAGIVAAEAVEQALREETRLVTVMHANNEIGTIQPIADIATICRQRDVPFHTDAVQSAGTIPVDVNELGVDMLSISAHKFYGPKGIGALYLRNGTEFRAQQLGGGQERTRRSGTENVPGAVGMAKALEKAVIQRDAAGKRMAEMRDYLFDALGIGEPNGSLNDRLPGNVNISFEGISGEALVIALDQQGVLASSGSACSSGSTEPSHVLLAIGCSPQVAGSALRLTLGRETTWEEIEWAARVIRATVERHSQGQPTKARQ